MDHEPTRLVAAVALLSIAVAVAAIGPAAGVASPAGAGPTDAVETPTAPTVTDAGGGTVAVAGGEAVPQATQSGTDIPIEWNRSYGGPQYDDAEAVIPTADGFLAVGTTASLGSGGDTDGWVLKLHANGSVAWSERYGDGSYQGFTDAVETDDGTYLLVGSNDGGWVVEIDASGTVLREDEYGPAVAAFTAVDGTGDGGAVVGGYVPALTTATTWAMELDAAGGVEWNRTAANSRLPVGTIADVTVTSDGRYLFAVQELNFLFDDVAALYELDEFGSVRWNRSYGTAERDDAFESVVETDDGSYVAAGRLGEDENDDGHGWVVSVDAETRTTEWNHTDSTDDRATAVIETRTGTLAVAGQAVGAGGGTFPWFAELDAASGDVVTDTPYLSSFGANATVNALAERPDGGFVAAGDVEPRPGDPTDALVVGTGLPDGVSYAGLDVSPATVTVGETVTVEATATNGRSVPRAYEATLFVSQPLCFDLSCGLAAVDDETGVLAPGESRTVTFERSFAFAGSYSVTVEDLPAESVSVAGSIDPGPGPVLAVGYSNLTVSPTAAGIGQPVSVSATVTNFGNVSNAYNATLEVDGRVVDRRNGTLAAGADERVTFARSFASAGRYDVTVDGLANETVTVGAGPGDVTGNGKAATDVDGDGMYEDVTGDGGFDVLDVAAFLDAFEDGAVTTNVAAFDFKADGQINVLDVAALLEET